MALKRRISYQWQIFIPLVAGMWLVLICMGAWTFYNTQKYKKDRVYEQLDLINARVMAFYNNGSTDEDVLPYLRFIYRYYLENETFDKIRITLYRKDSHGQDSLRLVLGEPVQLNQSERDRRQGLTANPGVELVSELQDRTHDAVSENSQYFYYQVKHSDDGEVTVCTVLPYDNDINEAIAPSTRVFIALFIVVLVITAIAWLSSKHVAKNIRLLRGVAEKAVTDPNFIPAVDFPHDELGDINRQIVHMFNERTQAMQRQKREHAVAMHAIEEKTRAKRQMSSNINHELRTPIGVIKGYLDTLIENPDMDKSTRQHFITKAQEHANRLISLISDVSAITRLEEGGDVISTEEIDFHDVVFTLSNDFEESGVLGSMQFNFDIPLDCKVMGNYNLLNAMLMNLARNAAAYSKGTLCEVICTGESEKFFEFVFRDNGTGVGEEHIPHLFERFYRIDSGRARKSGGTGLGLPIVQSTVLAHGGTITVENRPGGGLCFRFSLPKYKEPSNWNN